MITAIALIRGSLELAVWIGTKESLYPCEALACQCWHCRRNAFAHRQVLHQPLLRDRCMRDAHRCSAER